MIRWWYTKVSACLCGLITAIQVVAPLFTSPCDSSTREERLTLRLGRKSRWHEYRQSRPSICDISLILWGWYGLEYLKHNRNRWYILESAHIWNLSEGSLCLNWICLSFRFNFRALVSWGDSSYSGWSVAHSSFLFSWNSQNAQIDPLACLTTNQGQGFC